MDFEEAQIDGMNVVDLVVLREYALNHLTDLEGAYGIFQATTNELIKKGINLS